MWCDPFFSVLFCTNWVKDLIFILEDFAVFHFLFYLLWFLLRLICSGFPVPLPPSTVHLSMQSFIYLSIYLPIYLSVYLSMWLFTSLNTFRPYFILLQHTSNVRRFNQLLCLWVSAVGDISHIRLEVCFYSWIWSISNTHILTARFVCNSLVIRIRIMRRMKIGIIRRMKTRIIRWIWIRIVIRIRRRRRIRMIRRWKE